MKNKIKIKLLLLVPALLSVATTLTACGYSLNAGISK